VLVRLSLVRQMNDVPPFDAYAPRTNCSWPPVPLM
jgi:hypothetical protein